MESDEEGEVLALQDLQSDVNHYQQGHAIIGDNQDNDQDADVLLALTSGEDGDEESDSQLSRPSFSEKDSRAKSAAQALQRTTKRSRRYQSSRRKMSWYKQPEIRRNWKVVAGAFTLLGLGIASIIVGITVEVLKVLEDKEVIDGLILFGMAIIFLIPGVYFTVVICLAAHGFRRFRFDQIPFFKR